MDYPVLQYTLIRDLIYIEATAINHNINQYYATIIKFPEKLN